MTGVAVVHNNEAFRLHAWVDSEGFQHVTVRDAVTDRLICCQTFPILQRLLDAKAAK